MVLTANCRKIIKSRRATRFPKLSNQTHPVVHTVQFKIRSPVESLDAFTHLLGLYTVLTDRCHYDLMNIGMDSLRASLGCEQGTRPVKAAETIVENAARGEIGGDYAAALCNAPPFAQWPSDRCPLR